MPAFHAYKSRVMTETIWPAELKYLQSDSLQKKFANA